jgi:hypothetical protein
MENQQNKMNQRLKMLWKNAPTEVNRMYSSSETAIYPEWINAPDKIELVNGDKGMRTLDPIFKTNITGS